MENPFKMQNLTEEQVSKVIDYFDGKETDLTSSKAFFLYGVMKSQGIKIDKAEEEIKKSNKRRMESYKWNKEQEIYDKVKDYRSKNLSADPMFVLVNTKEREDGRTIEIGVEGNYNIERGKQTRTHTVLFEERQNPEYFQEIVKKFNLVID